MSVNSNISIIQYLFSVLESDFKAAIPYTVENVEYKILDLERSQAIGVYEMRSKIQNGTRTKKRELQLDDLVHNLKESNERTFRLHMIRESHEEEVLIVFSDLASEKVFGYLANF